MLKNLNVHKLGRAKKLHWWLTLYPLLELRNCSQGRKNMKYEPIMD